MSWLSDYLALKIPNSNPRTFRWGLAVARQFTSSISLGSNLILLRADDIKEVFNRNSDFERGAMAADKMLLGEFLLGMDPWPVYREMKQQLAEIMNYPKRLEFAEECAREAAINAYKGIEKDLVAGRKVDLITRFAVPALSNAAIEFMGLKKNTDAWKKLENSEVLKGPDIFAAMSRKVGSVIASGSPAPFGLQRLAEMASGEFYEFLFESIIARVKELDKSNYSPKGSRPTVMDAIIAADKISIDDLPTSGNKGGNKIKIATAKLGGLILGGSTPLMKGLALILRGLLQNQGSWKVKDKDALEFAVDSASAGEKNSIRKVILESMRFDPVFPILTRWCPRDTLLAAGTNREMKVKANTTVVLALLSGMFDESTHRKSETYAIERDQSSHFGFGHGPYRCIGKEAAMIQLKEVLTVLLGSNKPLFKNAKFRGISYDGPAVDKLIVSIEK